ncbi:complement factor H-like [Eleutherodactylus coqui]|uniref:complement factor H-like n=1 Tax=Eleutherodactylus coqui TaxID=57060 RepID=UPI00346334D9
MAEQFSYVEPSISPAEQFSYVEPSISPAEQSSYVEPGISRLSSPHQCRLPAGVGMNKDVKAYNVGDSVTVRCESGYRPSPENITCKNGSISEWDPPPRCIAQCRRPAGAGMVSTGREFYTAGDSLTVKCEPGYRPSYQNITCKGGPTKAEWDQTPQCIARCRRLDGVGMNSTSREFYNVGNSLTVRCEPGYRPSHQKITCRGGPTKDEWDQTPQCIAQCSRPAGTGMNSTGRKFYKAGEPLTVQCKLGYRPSYQQITCREGPTKDEWDQTPQCIAQCRRLTGEGIVPAGKEFYDIGEGLLVICETGYRLSSPSSSLSMKITCNNPRTASEWSSAPRCIAQCRRPAGAGMVSTGGQFYTVGDSLTVRCEPGYRPSYQKITCRGGPTEDEWDQTPQCIASIHDRTHGGCSACDPWDRKKEFFKSYLPPLDSSVFLSQTDTGGVSLC